VLEQAIHIIKTMVVYKLVFSTLGYSHLKILVICETQFYSFLNVKHTYTRMLQVKIHIVLSNANLWNVCALKPT